MKIYTLILQEQDDRGEITVQTGNSYLVQDDADHGCYLYVVKLMDAMNNSVPEGDNYDWPDGYWHLKRQPCGWAIFDEDERYCGGANWEERLLMRNKP